MSEFLVCDCGVRVMFSYLNAWNKLVVCGVLAVCWDGY